MVKQKNQLYFKDEMKFAKQREDLTRRNQFGYPCMKEPYPVVHEFEDYDGVEYYLSCKKN